MSTLKRACDEERIEKNTNCTERRKSVEGHEQFPGIGFGHDPASL